MKWRTTIRPLVAAIWILFSHAAPAQCEPMPGVPASVLAGLRPVGSLATNTYSGPADPVETSGVFRFHFVGDETLTYKIDTTDTNVRLGLLRVVEETSGVSVVSNAGFGFRAADGTEFDAANTLAQITTVFLPPTVANGVLTLRYRDTVLANLVAHARRYEISLVGKALRVRAYAVDPADVTPPTYAGFEIGPIENSGTLDDLKIPFAVSTPIAMAASTLLGDKVFVTTQVDWIKSHATGFSQPEDVLPKATPSAGLATLNNSVTLRYGVNPWRALNCAVDETFWLEVSRTLKDVFPETEAKPSPYRDVLANRTVALLTSGDGGHCSNNPSDPDGWTNYLSHLDQWQSWGMDLVVPWFFAYWSEAQWSYDPATPGCAGEHVSGQVPTSNWTPAHHAQTFEPLTTTALDRGMYMGAYTLYSPLQSGDPHYDPDDQVLQPSGGASLGFGLDMSPSRMIGHSEVGSPGTELEFAL